MDGGMRARVPAMFVFQRERDREESESTERGGGPGGPLILLLAARQREGERGRARATRGNRVGRYSAGGGIRPGGFLGNPLEFLFPLQLGPSSFF